ncbi:MAG: tRNA U-34 5-methylaminomethyl-2-thiouridine biosynthesis protein [Sphingomonadaceae bacterium]
MTIVSAFLLPGNPLPFLRQDNPPWQPIARASLLVGKALRQSNPDVLLIYSTQWFAVLDQLWQARPHSTGLHVDENWYEYGDLEMDIRADVDLATACVNAATAAGYRSKPVDYDGFPIDTGTIVANSFINPDGKIKTVIASNNLYYDFAKTEELGAIAAEQAALQGKRAAVIAIGGLSGNYFDRDIELSADRLVNEADDERNRTLLSIIEQGDIARLRNEIPAYVAAAKGDMGMKHLAWLLGASGGFDSATVHAYGATYGAGAAVIEFHL